MWDAASSSGRSSARPPPKVNPSGAPHSSYPMASSPQRYGASPTEQSKIALTRQNGPPSPGADPDFDRRVQEQLARMRLKGAAPRFEDDVDWEMRKLEQQLRTGGPAPGPHDAHRGEMMIDPSRREGPNQTYQGEQETRSLNGSGRGPNDEREMVANHGGFTAQLDAHRNGQRGNFGKGQGLRYMYGQPDEPPPPQGQRTGRGLKYMFDDQYGGQQLNEPPPSYFQQPASVQNTQRRREGLKGMWDGAPGGDTTAAAARQREIAAYRGALDEQVAGRAQLQEQQRRQEDEQWRQDQQWQRQHHQPNHRQQQQHQPLDRAPLSPPKYQQAHPARGRSSGGGMSSGGGGEVGSSSLPNSGDTSAVSAAARAKKAEYAAVLRQQMESDRLRRAAAKAKENEYDKRSAPPASSSHLDSQRRGPVPAQAYAPQYDGGGGGRNHASPPPQSAYGGGRDHNEYLAEGNGAEAGYDYRPPPSHYNGNHTAQDYSNLSDSRTYRNDGGAAQSPAPREQQFQYPDPSPMTVPGAGRVTAARQRLVEDIYGGGGMGAALGGRVGVREEAGEPHLGRQGVNTGSKPEASPAEARRKQAALEQQRFLQNQIDEKRRLKEEEEAQRRKDDEAEALRQAEEQRSLQAELDAKKQRQQREEEERLVKLQEQQAIAVTRRRGGGSVSGVAGADPSLSRSTAVRSSGSSRMAAALSGPPSPPVGRTLATAPPDWLPRDTTGSSLSQPIAQAYSPPIRRSADQDGGRSNTYDAGPTSPTLRSVNGGQHAYSPPLRSARSDRENHPQQTYDGPGSRMETRTSGSQQFASRKAPYAGAGDGYQDSIGRDPLAASKSVWKESLAGDSVMLAVNGGGRYRAEAQSDRDYVSRAQPLSRHGMPAGDEPFEDSLAASSRMLPGRGVYEQVGRTTSAAIRARPGGPVPRLSEPQEQSLTGESLLMYLTPRQRQNPILGEIHENDGDNGSVNSSGGTGAWLKGYGRQDDVRPSTATQEAESRAAADASSPLARLLMSTGPRTAPSREQNHDGESHYSTFNNINASQLEARGSRPSSSTSGLPEDGKKRAQWQSQAGREIAESLSARGKPWDSIDSGRGYKHGYEDDFDSS